MVLDHVTHHTGTFVVRATTLNTNRFGIGNLDVIDVLPVPDRLEDSVCKTKDDQILDSFFSQIVVDSVNLVFIKHGSDFSVKLSSGIEVCTEGLLDDDPCPVVFVLFGQTARAKILDGIRILGRCSRQIKYAIVPCAPFLRDLIEQRFELRVSLGIADVARDIEKALSKAGPDIVLNGLST